MNQNNINPKRIARLLRKRYKAGDNLLNLDQCAKQWIEILKQKDWQHLTTLSLNGCQIDDQNIKVLSNMNWPNLQQLQIQSNRLTTRGVKTLLKNPWPKLQSLELYQNNICNQGLLLLLKSMDKIQNLKIGHNDIVQMKLSYGPGLGQLHNSTLLELDISQNIIGSGGIKLLVKASFPLLQNLGVGSCHIGNEGILHLTKGYWPNLLYIQLQQNKVNYHGDVSALLFNMKKLQSLNVGNHSEEGFNNWSIDMISLMPYLCVLRTKVLLYATNPNQTFTEDMKTLISNKFKVNMYDHM